MERERDRLLPDTCGLQDVWNSKRPAQCRMQTNSVRHAARATKDATVNLFVSYVSFQFS